MLVIMAAMPSGAIAAGIADRYGYDGRLTAVIVVGTYLVGLVTIPVILITLAGFRERGEGWCLNNNLFY